MSGGLVNRLYIHMTLAHQGLENDWLHVHYGRWVSEGLRYEGAGACFFLTSCCTLVRVKVLLNCECVGLKTSTRGMNLL